MSHIQRMKARRKGLAPAFLNLSILVSAPRAVIAMVRRKVSSVLINSTALAGKRLRELNPITTRKRIANQGMVILPFSPSSLPATSFATKKAMTSNTGTSIITRIIFTMMALSDTSAPIALPAPTT